MRYLGIVSVTFLTMSSGRAFASTNLTCEIKADLASNRTTSFSLVKINRFLQEYKFQKTDGENGNCVEIEKSGTVGLVFHGQDADDFENEDVYLTFDRTSPHAFLTLDFKHSASRISFKSTECVYNVQ